MLFLFIQQSKCKANDHPMQVVDETRTDTMKRKVLSASVLTSCCDLVNEEQSAQALTSLLNWYRAACHYELEPSGMSSPDICYEIEDSETFPKVMIFVLQKADQTFRSILGLSSSSNKEKILKLKNNPKWDSVKPLVKSFFRSTIHLVKQAADLEITVFALAQLRVSFALKICRSKSYTKASVFITQLAKLSKMALSTKNKVLLSPCNVLSSTFFICLLSLFRFF